MERLKETGGRAQTTARHTELAWLTGTFRQRLIAFVRRAQPNTPIGDIEDALQDVLLRVHRNITEEAPPPAPRDWDRYMYQAVSNRLNDLRELTRRHTPYVEEQLATQPGQESDQPDASLECAERAALFQAFMKVMRREPICAEDHLGRVFAEVQKELHTRLQDRHWIVLRMRGLEGMGFQEIAGALDVSLGSVHGWYRAALDICAGVLRRHGAAGELP